MCTRCTAREQALLLLDKTRDFGAGFQAEDTMLMMLKPMFSGGSIDEQVRAADSRLLSNPGAISASCHSACARVQYPDTVYCTRLGGEARSNPASRRTGHPWRLRAGFPKRCCLGWRSRGAPPSRRECPRTGCRSQHPSLPPSLFSSLRLTFLHGVFALIQGLRARASCQVKSLMRSVPLPR